MSAVRKIAARIAVDDTFRAMVEGMRAEILTMDRGLPMSMFDVS